MLSEFRENKGQCWAINLLIFLFCEPCTNKIAFFNNLLALISNQPWDKENRVRDFLLFYYFLNNQFLTVSMQNTL